MRIFLYAILAAALIAAPAAADDSARVDTTLDLIATSTTLAAGASTIVTRDVSMSEVQGLDWYMTSAAAISCAVQIRASNAFAGPYDYPASINDTSTTTTFTITDGTNATDLRLIPAKWQEFTFVNNGAASLVLRRVTLFTY